MKLKAQFRVSQHEVTHAQADHKKHAERRFAEDFANELMKYVQVEERKDDYSPDTIFEAEIYVLPKSQFEHILGMLKTLRGVSPAVDSVVSQIRDELVNR